MANIDSKIPEGPISEKWTNYKAHQKLVNPANKRKLDIIVVGTGLAGASAAASLGEMGFKVLNFCIQDSPRRAHSIAAQGGINAAKNYQNDGDSVYRLFYDTVKGGDYRAREANVYRLAEVSANIIDQCVAQGVPFVEGVSSACDGYEMMVVTFSCPVFTVLYLVWFAALWFHMTHGFWSAFQTLGWNGKVWFCRWRMIGTIYVSVLMLIFVVVALKFALCGSCCGSVCC